VVVEVARARYTAFCFFCCHCSLPSPSPLLRYQNGRTTANNMPKEFLDAEQLQRSDQLYFTHKALSSIEAAAREAVKQHDKYIDAVDKVISAILDNSDCMEETRRLFGSSGETAIAPTFEVTGRLSDAFTAWKSSTEVRKLRADLEALGDLSRTAKRSVKLAEESSSDLEKAAQKAAKYNTKNVEKRMKHGYSARLTRRKEQWNAANTQVLVMDNAVIESMLSLGKWWSGKLVAVTEGLCASYAHIGAVTTTLFSSHSVNLSPTGEQLQAPPSPRPSTQQLLRGASPVTSQPSQPQGHVNPMLLSSSSAQLSCVSSRQKPRTATGAGGAATRAPTTAVAGAGGLAENAPPPLFALAAAQHRDAADLHKHNGGDNSSSRSHDNGRAAATLVAGPTVTDHSAVGNAKQFSGE
jgi:vacuolar-type H+-ATPase subunit H